MRNRHAAVLSRRIMRATSLTRLSPLSQFVAALLGPIHGVMAGRAAGRTGHPLPLLSVQLASHRGNGWPAKAGHDDILELLQR
jgi:hypothetical protein